MPDNRVGKFKDKLSRDRKPYARPKGKIRRVIDSVSGILGGSWIPGFLRTEEDESEEEQTVETARVAAEEPKPGPSGFVPNTSFYPEEDASYEADDALSRILVQENSSLLTNIPIQLERSVPSNTGHTPSLSNVWQSSMATPTFEREIKTPYFAQPSSSRTSVPKPLTDFESSESGTKRPAENSPTGDGLFSASSFLSQSSSKRPRFSLSAYSAMANSSMQSPLSENSFRSSPYYPGRTAYGGAAAYRRPHTPLQRTVAASPLPSPGGLSDAAQRILTCLNSLSTPLTEAKRVPAPAATASPYSSYLDSPYTSAFHRHKPPPASPLNTPARASVSLMTPLRRTDTELLQASKPTSTQGLPATSSVADDRPSIFSVAAASSSKSSTSMYTTRSADSGSKGKTGAVSESSDKIISMDGRGSLAKTGASLQKAQTSASHKQAEHLDMNVASQSDWASSGGGKMGHGKKFSSHASSAKLVPEKDGNFIMPSLPRVSLPKFAFSTPISLPLVKPDITRHTSPLSTPIVAPPKCMFEFSAPKVLENRHVKVLEQSSRFEFSAPSPCSGETPSTSGKIASAPLPKRLERNLSGSGANKILNTNAADMLAFLRKGSEDCKKPDEPKKVNIDAKKTDTTSSFGSQFKPATGSWECDTCMVRNNAGVEVCVSCMSKKPGSVKPASSAPKTLPSSGFGSQFKTPSGSWECGACMLRNTADVAKCVACETAKPGTGTSSKPTLPPSKPSLPAPVSSGFGDMFKKSSGEWECSACMLRNKSTETKCVACMESKPGASNSVSSTIKFGVVNDSVKNSTGGFSFGVSATSNSQATSSFTFGAPTALVSSAAATTTSSSVSSSDSSCAAGKLGASKVKSDKAPASSGFKFGVAATAPEPTKGFQGFGDKFKKSAGDWECKVCLVNNKVSATKCISCEDVRESAANNSKLSTGSFQFGVKPSLSLSKSNASGFSFGVSTTAASAGASSTSSIAAISSGASSISSLGATSIDSSKLGSAVTTSSSFGFGSVVSSGTNKVSSGFSFGAIAAPIPSKNAFGTDSQAPSADFGFGSSTTKVSKTEKAPSGFSFGTSSAAKESFGGKSSADPVKPTSTFTFGASNTSKTTNGISSSGSTASSFSFGTAAASRESKPKEKSAVSTFTFGGAKAQENASLVAPIENGKKSSDSGVFGFDAKTNSKENPITKLFSQNNGDSSVGEARLNNGVGSTSVNGTSAFGAPAKAPFTFGNNQPTTNGGSVPVFGGATFNNNNNIETPKSFAFGQPAEKKLAAATFNFGQSAGGLGAPNKVAPSLSFGQAAEVKSNGGGLFQFGDNQAASPAIPAFGSHANVFSQSTPSGRTIKRGIRRNRK